MIITNTIDLCNALKYLVPTANCCVWGTSDITQYYGETPPILRFNMLVDWRSFTPCPTEQDITNINSTAFNTALAAQQQQSTVSSLLNDINNNVGLKAAYYIAKQNNPGLTLQNFIKNILNS